MSTYAAADPATVEEELNTQATALDTLGKSLDAAVERLDNAEAAWDTLYDAVAENLAEENESNRAPAEHLILSTARRQHRAEYQELRRAKRNLDKIERQLQSVGKVLSARQTQSSGLREELRAGTFSR